MKRVRWLGAVALMISLVGSRSFAYLSEGKALTGGQKEIRLLSDQFGLGPVATQDAHSKYQEAVSHGNVFICANPAGTAVTTAAGLSANNPALALWNPAGSGRNLVLWEDGIDLTASPGAAAGFMLAYNTVTSSSASQGLVSTTLANVVGANLNLNSTPAGQCYRASQLPATPTAIRYVGGTTGASAIGGVTMVDNVDGKIIIPPGAIVSIQATSAAAIIAHLMWEEVPVNAF